MLQHFEGYKDQPYWDVNHWRVGYGSDTITKADGTVQTVAPGMKITAEDADRDLQRRVGLTQKGIQASIGADRWNSLPASAQSALTSISYNYGKDGYLPANVLNAAKSGSLQDISAAIAARAEDNGGVNSSRRQQEAGAVLGQFTAGTPNYEAMKAQAYKNVTSSDLSPLAQQHALQTINRSLSAQEIADNVTIKARSEANEAARGEYFGQIVHGQIDGLQEKILSDPRLKPETQEHLVGLLKKESGENDTSTYGPGYAEVYKGLVAPPGAPNRITDANAILQRGAPGGDLTIKGVDRLLKIQKDATKDPDAASTHRVISNLEQYAKGKMTYAEESQIPGYKGLADPKGTALFQSTFIPQFEAAYEQAAKSGKGREFLTKDNVDSMVKQLRSAQQIAQDKMEEMTGAAKVEIPPPPEGVEPQRWQAEVQNPAHGYSPQRWGQILTILTSNPTEERQKSFDSHFGPRGARPAAEIVKDLHVGQ
jgi:GH24 family phage-related lysozyme (muramidase)